MNIAKWNLHKKSNAVPGSLETHISLLPGTKRILFKTLNYATWLDKDNITAPTLRNCSQVPPFPIEVDGAVGAVIGGHVVICGGEEEMYVSSKDMLTSQCWMLNPRYG